MKNITPGKSKPLLDIKYRSCKPKTLQPEVITIDHVFEEKMYPADTLIETIDNMISDEKNRTITVNQVIENHLKILKIQGGQITEVEMFADLVRRNLESLEYTLNNIGKININLLKKLHKKYQQGHKSVSKQKETVFILSLFSYS